MSTQPCRVKAFKTGPSPNPAADKAEELLERWLADQLKEDYVLHSLAGAKSSSGDDTLWAVTHYNPRAANEMSGQGAG